MNKHLLSTFAAAMLPIGMTSASVQLAGGYSYLDNRNSRQNAYLSSNNLRSSKYAIEPTNKDTVVLKNNTVNAFSTVSLQQIPSFDFDLTLSTSDERLVINSDIAKNTSIQAESKLLQLVSHHYINELIIIDAAVPDKHVFYQSVKPGVEIIEIVSEQNGLLQLNRILSNYQNLDVLHLVSHADDGVIYLGNTVVTEQLLKEKVETFTALNNALNENADLLIYGCDLAKTAKGESLLELIANKSHIDIAASNNLTGSKKNGGDWELEIEKGDISSIAPFNSVALNDFTDVLSVNKTIDMSGFNHTGYVEPNTYSFSGYTARLSSSDLVTVGSMACRNYGNSACYEDWGINGDGDKKIYFDFTNGEQFNLTSIYLYSAAAQNITLQSDNNDTKNFSLASGENTIEVLNWTGITKLTIRRTDDTNLTQIKFDDFVLTNITAAADSDSSLTAAANVIEPVGINTTLDTIGEAIDVFDFTLNDGGTADGLATAITQVVVNVTGTASDTERAKVTWRLNGNDASNITGVYSAGSNTITFSGLAISVADGGNEIYTVNAYYNDNSAITENKTFILSIDGDTDLTVDSNGTQMGSTTVINNGSGGTFEVTASALVFSTQPSGSVSGSVLTTQPVIVAQDAFGNTDIDFTETVTLTEASAGLLSSNTATASSGVATFSNLYYTATADQQSFTLTANDQDGVGSNLATVDANAVTSDVVATQLAFSTQPAPLSTQNSVATNFSTVPVVSAQDANGLVDTGYSTNITLSEVNGAGSATLTGTGDTDGSANTVSITPSSGVSTFTGLQVTYTVNGGSSENFNLQASSGGLSTVNSSQLVGLLADSDSSLTAAANVIEPVGINTTLDTVGEAIDVFDFTLSDGGTADGLATTINQVVVNVTGTASDAERAKVTWRLNGNDVSNVTGVYNGGSNTITFSGLAISVADGGNEIYTVNAYYNDNSAITENKTFILSIDGDTDLTVGSNGTQMSNTTAINNGTGGTFDVTATALVFSTQPSGSVSGSVLTTQPVIMAQDAFGNTDIDFTETVTLTEGSAGSLSSNTTAASSGVATFSNLNYTATADQQSFTLTANDQDSVGSNLATVDANAVTSDVVATQLSFSTQPGPLSIVSGELTTLSPVAVVSAQDGNGLLDTGYSATVTLIEVNGPGTGTMSATGDIDGIATTVTVNSSAGISTFTGLQLTYSASGGADETFNLRAFSGGLSIAESSQFVSGTFDSDATVTSASGVNEPVSIASFVDTSGEAVELLDFTINDGGTSDNKPTLVSSIQVHASGTVEANKFTYLLNGPDVSNIVGSLNAGVLTFSGLNISVLNSESEVYTISSYYNDTSDLIEGKTLILTTDGDSDFSLSIGSTIMAATSPISNNTGSTVDIIATELRFIAQPSGAVSGLALTTQPVIHSTDVFGNIDTSFTETITLTESSAGTLNNNSQSAVSGIATFTGLSYTATEDQQSFQLRANDNDSTGTDLSEITANSLISDVIATQLVFDSYLTPAVVSSEQNSLDDSFALYNTDYEQPIVITAKDSSGLMDIDYNNEVTITQGIINTGSAFTVSTTNDLDSTTNSITLTAVNGKTSFTDLNIGYKGTSANDILRLDASDNLVGTSSAIGANIAVNIAPYVKEQTDDFGPVVDEDVKTVLDTSDIQVHDADGDVILLTLSVDKGLIFSLNGDSVQNGVTIVDSNDTEGSQSISLTGSELDINNLLDTSHFEYLTALNDINGPTFSIKANDGVIDGHNVVTEVFTVNAVNDAPTISGIPSTTVAEGSHYSFTPTASDVDIDDTKTFSITNKPRWASFSTTTGELSGTPGDNDVEVTSNIIITVTDSENANSSLTAFDIEVTNVNDAPVISGTPSLIVAEDSAYNFIPTVTDLDRGDILTFSIINKPNWASFNSVSGELSGVPDNNHIGTSSNITISVTDSAGATANLKHFDVTVINTNDAPVISGEPRLTISEGDSYSFTPIVTDADIGDTKAFSITNKPSWAIFNNGTGVLTGNPNNDDVGTTSNIIITVVDNANVADSLAPFNLKVLNVNDAPVISGVPESQVEENSDYRFTPTVTDIDDNDDHTFSITGKPEWMQFDELTGEMLGTPLQNDVGATSNIIITVNDNSGEDNATDSLIFSVTVNNVNQAPEAVRDTFQLERNIENTYILDVLSNDKDIDGDLLSITGATASIGSVEYKGKDLILTTQAGFIGQITLLYTVTDNNDTFADGIVELVINGELNGSEPIVTAPESIEVNATALYTKVDLGVATAVNSKGQSLAVSLVDGNSIFRPGNHIAYWQTTDPETGLTTVVSQSVIVNPLISLSKNQTIVEGNKAVIDVILNGDAPKYPLTVTLNIVGGTDEIDYTIENNQVTIDSGTQGKMVINTIQDNEVEGDEILTLSIDEGNVANDSNHILTIVETNVPPEVSLMSLQNNEARQTVTIAGGLVIVQAKVTDANDDTVSTLWSYDSALNIVNVDDKTITFDPSELSVGVYHLALTATDSGDGNLNITKSIYLAVVENLVELTDSDTDGDRIPDNEEGYSDKDQDGIPDFQDAIAECNVMPENSLTQNAFLVEGEPGVCLRKGNTIANGETGGLQLTVNDLESSIGMDSEAIIVGGIFDYIVTGLPELGQNYQIVLPQRLPIPFGAVYRKYSESMGWGTFVEDANNQVFSSAGIPGYCPPPSSTLWTLGLTEGFWCVQLTIEDGGPNDNDGIRNGTIVDPGGVSVMLTNNVMPVAQEDFVRIKRNQLTVIDVLANDTDSDQDILNIGVVTTTFGSVSITPDNKVEYLSGIDFIGEDTIIYGISDGNGGSDSSKVSITVYNNNAPVAIDDNVKTNDRTDIIINALVNDSDADDDNLVIVKAIVDNGNVKINEDSTLTYTPESGFEGIAIITYTIDDGQGDQANAKVTVSVSSFKTVTVENKSKGGSMGLMISVLMSIVLYRFRRKPNIIKKHFVKGTLALAALTSINLAAAEPNWFVTGSVGKSHASTDFTVPSDIGTNESSLEKSGTSYSLGAGIKYDLYSFILSYEFLGDSSASFTGDVLDTASFHKALVEIAPKLVDGISLQSQYTFWQNDEVNASIGLGLFAWELDYTSTLNNSAIKVNEDDIDLFYNIQADYKLTEQVKISIKVTRYNLSVNNVNNIGMGLTYQF
jgi:hypothetical protein